MLMRLWTGRPAFVRECTLHKEKYNESNAAAFLHSLKLNSQRLLREQCYKLIFFLNFNERQVSSAIWPFVRCLYLSVYFIIPRCALGLDKHNCVYICIRFYKPYVAGHLIEGANKRHRRVFLSSVNCPRGALPWPNGTHALLLPPRCSAEWNFSLLSPILLSDDGRDSLDIQSGCVVLCY